MRTRLGQLCARYCRQLNKYKACIFPCTSDLCRECLVAPHTVAHLFDCLKHPTYLTVHNCSCFAWINQLKQQFLSSSSTTNSWQPDNMIHDDMMGSTIFSNAEVLAWLRDPTAKLEYSADFKAQRCLWSASSLLLNVHHRLSTALTFEQSAPTCHICTFYILFSEVTLRFSSSGISFHEICCNIFM